MLPEIFAALNYGIVGRAIAQQLVKISYWNLRNYATDKWHVDDRSYGGGPGMVMCYQPLYEAIAAAKKSMPSNCKTIYLSPQGKLIEQANLLQVVSDQQSLLFIAGRYEGIDERIINDLVDEEWSAGNFVLSGGEFAALVFMDAIIRLLPGSLKDKEAINNESFMSGLLDYPHYTRPALIKNKAVPEVLLSGDHKKISRWRRQQMLGKTWLKRPEVLANLLLSTEDQQLLKEFKQGYFGSNDE